MKQLLSIMILSAFFQALTPRLLAQQADFSGSWSILKDKIEWGQAPEWVLPKSFTITQSKERISLQRTILDDKMGEHAYTEDMPFDGSAVETTTYTGGKRSSSLKWQDDHQSFTLSTQGTSSDGSPGSKVSETWSLSDGGKTLVIDRQVEQTNGLKYTIKAYFQKA